jgi:hypothetical protein
VKRLGAVKVPWRERVYALYKGEALIADGTIQEIHEKTGKTFNHLRFMIYPAYEKRCKGKNCLQMVRLDGEEEDDF